MPSPFQRLTLQQFADVLNAFRFTRRITAVHMHHTWRPDHRMWRGAASMEGMWRSHTQERGFSDIAQHLTIDPEGFVWTGRNWNASPASAVGHNGTSQAGPFMFEIVGNFDRGGDPFGGAQRQSALDVVVLVNRKFGLDPATLLFHNQVAAKTCPGNTIDRAAFVAEVGAHVPSTDAAPATRSRGAAKVAKSRSMPLPPSAFADTTDPDFVRRTVALIERAAAASRSADASATPLEELDYGFDTTLPAGASRDARGGFGNLAQGSRLTRADVDALRPYVINLRQGRFSQDGLMTSSPADVDMILFEHAAAAAKLAVTDGHPFRLLLYAHGGLVRESRGLEIAQSQVGWWRDNGVYPIHFIWETGFFETLRDLLARARDGSGVSRGVVSDFITDPLIERAARILQAPRIWGGMKASAQMASAPDGGARFFVERLAEFGKQFAKKHPQGRLELHAVGHSAGSIFLAHLLQAAAAVKGSDPFASLQMMAPAIRADLFKQLVAPLVGAGKGAGELTMYTMRRDYERDDDCAKIYRKSLLYLVSAACEVDTGAAILGLEDSLRADAALAGFFGLGGAAGKAEVVWSKSAAVEGRSATQAVHHGDFDNDGPTMESVARRVIGLDDTTALARPFPREGTRGPGDPWNDGADWPPDFPPAGAGSGGIVTPVAAPAPVPGSGGTPALGSGSGSAPAPDDPSQPRGRRLALCVGVDTYAKAPLAGCVNDAKLWQETLQGLGFEVRTLFDEEAKQAPLFAAMRRLFAEAQAGDEIVFQFAGHGTQAQDVDGDEAGGDTPGLDEALCPHDYEEGPLIIDDEIGALVNGVAAGARITFFMDCCHSGSNTRAAPTPGARSRSVRLSPAEQAAYVAWRERQPGSRSPMPRREDSDPVEVAFAARQSKELAWESEGHGAFTLRATKLLREGGGAALSPDRFYQRVLDAFGSDRRQTPAFTAPPERLAQSLFRG